MENVQERVMFTVGIVGTGKIAGLFDKPGHCVETGTHAQAIFNNPDLRISCAVDVNRESLNRYSDTWNISTRFSKLEELLGTCLPDIVSICSSSETHFATARSLLGHSEPPKVLLIEKPVTMTREQLDQLVALSKRSRSEIVVNHPRRVDPGHKLLQEIIAAGEIGDAVEGRFTYYGGWLNNGVHLLDLLIMLFGDGFSFGDARAKEFGRPRDRCYDTVLDYKDFKVSIGSFDEKHYQLFEGELRFTKGRVHYLDFGKRIAIERSRENDIGERELKPDGRYNIQCLSSPLKHGYDSIVRYLRSGDESGLCGLLLGDAQKVMNRLFTLKSMGDRA